ncbi:MAG: YgaP-like transmembrane domain [Chloroflexota bacterium]
MYLENGRDLFRGSMILLAAALAYWVDLTAGLLLAVFVGVMILQSVFTDWCPADLILKPMGLKSKLKSQKI